MPRGVYERKAKKAKTAGGAAKEPRPNGFPDLVMRMRAEKVKAEDRVVALGTAIEVLEGLE